MVPPHVQDHTPLVFHNLSSNGLLLSHSIQSVAGFFSQDSPTASGIQAVNSFPCVPSFESKSLNDQIPPRFGLLDDSTDRWNRFFAEIDKLNKSANNNASFKVLLFGRHGQGFRKTGHFRFCFLIVHSGSIKTT